MARKVNGSCASCKRQRKKCPESCVLAPHFPSTDTKKFDVVQRVFGTSHVIKTLQGVEDYQRADVVNSILYESSARVKDPVHGCAGIVYQLQAKIAELESQLAATQAEVVSMRLKRDEMASLLIGGYH
ncbi:hypothetical protein KI387_002869, partial [Taxus chinensis]